MIVIIIKLDLLYYLDLHISCENTIEMIVNFWKRKF